MMSEQELKKVEIICQIIAKKIFKFSKKTIASEMINLEMNINETISSIIMVLTSFTFNMILTTKNAMENISKNEIDLEKIMNFYILDIQGLVQKEILSKKQKERH